MVHAANNLVSGGRAKGLRIMLISQRPAKLHKDSLTQVETLIAMRLIAPQDRAAVEDWIGEWADPKQGREVIASMPSLPRGTGWAWAPELGVLRKMAFPLIATFDSSITPEHGEPAKSPVDLSAIDITALRDALVVVETGVSAAPQSRRPFTRPAGRGREERLRARLGRSKRAGAPGGRRFNNGIPAHAEGRERGPTPTSHSIAFACSARAQTAAGGSAGALRQRPARTPHPARTRRPSSRPLHARAVGDARGDETHWRDVADLCQPPAHRGLYRRGRRDHRRDVRRYRRGRSA